MARRTVAELLESVKSLIGEKEGVENLLEDLTDSYVDDITGYVKKDEYDLMQRERDKAIAEKEDMRAKYINRFYGNYDRENEKGYILGQASEASIIDEEEKDYYKALFE